MNSDFHRFHLGNYECVTLYDGYYDYKLEQMVANAPQVDIEEALRGHGFSPEFVTTPFTSLYVNTGKNRILVDLGAGKALPTAGKLLHSMQHAGLTPEGIDSIIITHAHGDHVNGMLNEDAQLNFPHATYYIRRAEWDYWFSEQAIAQTGEWMTSFARKNLSPIKDKTILLDQEEEILPGVSVLFASGHTPGHMVVSFMSENERLLYIGDTVLHPLHLEHPDWLPVFDILPEPAAISKQRIFDLAASTNCWVVGQQFPLFPSLGHVIKKEVGWEWQP